MSKSIEVINIGGVDYGVKDAVVRKTFDRVAASPNINNFLYKTNYYKNTAGADVALEGYSIFKITPASGDIIILKSKDRNHLFGGNLNQNFWAVVKYTSSWYSLTQGTALNFGCLDEYFGEAICIGLPNVNELYFSIKNDYIDTVELFYNSHSVFGSSASDSIGRDEMISRIMQENCITMKRIYHRNGSYWDKLSVSSDDPTIRTCYRRVSAGEKYVIDRDTPGYFGAGMFFSSDGMTIVSVHAPSYTVPKNGWIMFFIDRSDQIEIYRYPSNPAKMEYRNIVGAPDPDTSFLLGNKKVVTFGDSIVARNTWQPLVSDILGGNWINCGIGSTPLSGDNANAFWRDSRINAVKEYNPEIIIMMGGANDLVLNPVIGNASDIESKDTDTFIGAYSYIIDNFLSWKPSVKIIIISTTWAHNDGKKYSETVTYGDFAQASKLVAGHYHLPYVNMYDESGFNQYTMGSGTRAVYAEDEIHPNAAGSVILASMVASKIREILVAGAQ